MRTHMMRLGLLFCVIVLVATTLSASAQEQPIKLRVGLGDVSLNKLPFVTAYEEGIYKKNGLEVEQFVTPSAADVARRSASMYRKNLSAPGDGKFRL